jgi:hypothetical protein
VNKICTDLMERLERLLSRNWLCCGLIGLFAFLVWGQTIGYGFVWDDDILVSRNKSIRSLRNVPAIFSRLDAQSEQEAPSFRPVRTTFYALLYAADGQETPRPWIFHLANVAWHSAASMLLFSTALLLWERLAGSVTTGMRTAALLMALGFAAHPANAEAVCWVKCLDDLMAGVFVLAAARAVLKWNGGWRGLAAALVWFLLAAFSYESAVPFALAVFLLFYGFHKLPWRRSAQLTLPFLLAAFFFAGWRQLVIGRASQCDPLSGSYGQTLIDMLPVVTEYARLLFGIPPFCADYNYLGTEPPYAFFSGKALGGLALALAAGGLAVSLWRRPRWRLAAFGLAWTGLFLLPVSNLIPMMQYMAERFLYLPVMGFLLALGGVFVNFSRPRVVAAAAVAVVGVWIAASVNRMGIWRDGLTLFVATEFEHPGIKRVEQNAVAAIYGLPQMAPLFPDYRKTGSVRMADVLSPEQGDAIRRTLEEARRLYPNNAMLTTDLGFVEAKMGRWPRALALVELAARQKPDSAQYQLNLASLYLATGQALRAQGACAEALRLKPEFEEARSLQAKIENELKAEKARGP